MAGITPRPTIDVDDDKDIAVICARRARLNALIPKATQRERALIALFRYLQFRRLRNKTSDLRGDLKDPDPYNPLYVFYCMRLKGCSV